MTKTNNPTFSECIKQPNIVFPFFLIVEKESIDLMIANWEEECSGTINNPNYSGLLKASSTSDILDYLSQFFCYQHKWILA